MLFSQKLLSEVIFQPHSMTSPALPMSMLRVIVRVMYKGRNCTNTSATIRIIVNRKARFMLLHHLRYARFERIAFFLGIESSSTKR